jgi:hypothetical protein
MAFIESTSLWPPLSQTTYGTNVGIDANIRPSNCTLWLFSLFFDPDIKQMHHMLPESLIHAVGHHDTQMIFLLLILYARFYRWPFGCRRQCDEDGSQHY